MATKFQKYLAKFRKPTTQNNSQSPSGPFSTCRILPRCGNPRTASFSLERGGYVEYGGDDVVTATDRTNGLVFDSFNSLFEQNIDSSERDEERGPGDSIESPRQLVESSPKIKACAHPDQAVESTVGQCLLEDLESIYYGDIENGEKERVEDCAVDLNKSWRKSSDSAENNKVRPHAGRIKVSDIERLVSGSLKIDKNSDMGEKQRSRISFEWSHQLHDSDPEINLCHSNRFFVTTDRSSSLLEEAWMSLTASEDAASNASTVTVMTDSPAIVPGYQRNDHHPELPGDSIAVMTSSVNPYDDFNRSMKEMIQARLQQGGETDWEFMEELLFCYLNLNEKALHRYILKAFVDLVSASSTAKLRRSSGDLRQCSCCITKEMRKTEI